MTPRLAAGDVFTPTRPIRGGKDLIGREREIARVLQALKDERAHVVLYAERGRGKTSLVNAVIRNLRASGHIVARHTCEAGSTYDSIMRGVVADLPRSLLAIPGNSDVQADGSPSEGCDAALPPGPLRPNDIVTLPSRLTTPELVCVIDEFDRIEDPTTRTRLADTIKQLSDRGTAVSFMIVGVSNSLDEILGQHPSIQRALVAVQLPLLGRDAVAQLISGGFRRAGVSYDQTLLDCLVTLSLGMPYMTQLLGLRVLQAVQARRGTAITGGDLRSAIERVIEETNPATSALYDRMVDHGGDRAMIEALQRLAHARQDAFGCIDVEIGQGVGQAGDQIIQLGCLERLQDAGIILPCTSDAQGYVGRKYRFGERSLIHYVLLLAVLGDIPLVSQPAQSVAALNWSKQT